MPQYNFDINSAMQAGYTPDQISKFLAQQKSNGNDFQLTPTPQATPQQSQQPAPQQPKSNWLTDALPTVGSVVGGVAGAAIPILGETGIGEVGGAAAGSALGEAAKEFLTGQKLSGRDIATQGVIGGVGGVAGKGIGAVAGKVLSKVGGGVAPALDNAATELTQGTRQIRVKPSVYGASQEKAVNATLDKYGIRGTAQQQYSQLQPALTTIEGKINKVIQDNPAAGAKRQDIVDEFNKNLASGLRSGDLTKSQAKGEINGYLKDLETAAGVDNPGKSDVITLDQLRNLKKLVNEDYGPVYSKSQAGQALTPRQKVISAAWDSLDSAVKGASPEVKGLLTDESNLYKSAKSLSAARSNPPTLRVMGTSVPAPVTQAGRDIAGMALKGAGAVAGSTPGQLPPLVRGSIGQTVVRPFMSEGVDQNNQNGQNNPQNNSQSNSGQYDTASNNNQNNLPFSPEQAFADNSTIQNQQSQGLPPSPNTPPAPDFKPPANFMAGYSVNGKPISTADKNMIWQITNYRLDPTKTTSLRNNERERVISLASQFDPSYDATQFPVKQKIRDDFTSGKSAQNIRSLNTAVSHLNALAEAGNGLGNSSFTPYNQFKNTVSQATGQPSVVRFNDALNAVAGEMATVFKGTSGTDEEINSWKQQMSASQSPAQIQAGINQMIELMAGRLQALQSQYQTGMGKPTNFSLLNPRSQAILQKLGIDAGQLEDPNALPANP